MRGADRATVPGLVQRLARMADVRLRQALAEAGMDDLRPAAARLLVPLITADHRAAELAATFAVTPQAVAQVVANLERGGYVARVPDPADARAKLIRLTPRGRSALRVARTTAQATQARWAARVGEDALTEFRRTVTTLVTEPDGDGRPLPGSPPPP